jgi:hypothetical protein
MRGTGGESEAVQGGDECVMYGSLESSMYVCACASTATATGSGGPTRYKSWREPHTRLCVVLHKVGAQEDSAPR